MGGSGGGIPRLFDNRIASAIAMLDTAWIIATGGGLFCLCSSIILEISSFSPITCARPLTLCNRRTVIHRENKGSIGCGLIFHVQSDDIDINSNLDLRWQLRVLTPETLPGKIRNLHSHSRHSTCSSKQVKSWRYYGFCRASTLPDIWRILF